MMIPKNNKFLTRHGFGVHSPWAYDFIVNVIGESRPYYAYDDLYDFWQETPQELPQFSQREDELLFRVVNSINPSLSVEVGTGSGLSTAYIASVSKKSKVLTLDTPNSLTTQVRNNLSKFPNVEFSCGNLETILKDMSAGMDRKIDFLHIAHTRYVYNVFEVLYNCLCPGSIVVVHDIIRQNRNWWKDIVADARTGITFAVKNVGIITFDKTKYKQHYRL